MSLERVFLPTEKMALPGDVRRFLHEADRRIDRFLHSCWAPGFVASDFACVYASLCRLETSGLAPGRYFCEWGSGFGVVSCLAAMLGFDAWGIEIRGELVDASRRLADDFDLPVEFGRGSFVPRRAGSAGGAGYEEIGLEIKDFDVIFAYPWPHEERRTARLFHRHARVGTLLLTYHGGDEVRLRRRT
jgi:hypothetical protein